MLLKYLKEKTKFHFVLKQLLDQNQANQAHDVDFIKIDIHVLDVKGHILLSVKSKESPNLDYTNI